MTKPEPLAPPPPPTTRHFITYDAQGAILRQVSTPSDHYDCQPLRPGERKLEGRADGDTQKVVDGKVVDKTPAEISLMKRANPRLHFDTGK